MKPIKSTTIFSCTKCGAQYPKWQGRCLECGSWGTLVEEASKVSAAKNLKPGKLADKPLNLKDVEILDQERLKTGSEEIDRVLGGGIVKGSLILIGGDPGVGKSTLALQIINHVPNCLYVSGEESASQVKMRAERLKTNLDKLHFLPQTDIETVIASIRETKPAMVIIDSIQTMNYAELPGGLGSANQLSACTSLLLEAAKATNIPILIIGHVTKDGFVAGPKALEHLVDAVLYLERDDQNFYQILRSVKNRFGATGEIGLFEMTTIGFREIKNPAEIFLSGHDDNSSGKATTAVLEGSRTFLAEIQALVNKTAFGYPQRRATGFDLNRLQMLIAVLAKTAKINLGNHDVYLNIAGGLKIKDPAADLAVCLAIASAFLDIPVGTKTLALGEIGLSGEVRSASQTEIRLKEAKKLGFNKIIMPPGKNKTASSEAVLVKNLAEAIKLLK